MTLHKNWIEGPSGLSIYHSGPDLDQGALPALFYFALSGNDSLCLDPYNQPATFLANSPIRVFSFNLPGHDLSQNPTEAMGLWALEIGKGHDLISEFISQCVKNIAYLIDQNLVSAKKIAVAGLSRGGFIAAHLAAREPKIRYLLGYAPLTHLHILSEFQSLEHSPLVKQLSFSHIADQLTQTHTRFYIGNRDLRVSTDACYESIKILTEKAYAQGIRSPEAELVISPSIGHKGHGTSPHVFKEGIRWIKANFLLEE